MEDLYKTLTKPTNEILFKDKGSKFFGYAFPINNKEDLAYFLEEIKNKHSNARHYCYAWQIGTEKDKIQYRINDDGEPPNTAGMPIYGQIQSFDITNVLIVVVRYFGGTKLGVSGLINAYKITAKMCLEQAHIETKTIDIYFKISFEYKHMNTVMRIIKERNLNIKNQIMNLSCEIIVSIRKSKIAEISDSFKPFHKIKIIKM